MTQQSNSRSDRPRPGPVQTLGCSPQSGVSSVVSQPPESLDFDEKLLDEGHLRLHLRGLKTLADDLEVTLKASAQDPARAVDLESVISPLVKNEAFGAQIQFTCEGARWLDTLIATREGVRLVRLQLTA